MIYRENKKNQLPENIQTCINQYKNALNDYSLNDYKMRLHEHSMDEHGNHNASFKQASDERYKAMENMRESLRTAFFLAKKDYNDYSKSNENANLINDTAFEFHWAISNSIYNQSEAYECQEFLDITPEITIEESFRNEIDYQSAMASIGMDIKTKEQVQDKDDSKDDIAPDIEQEYGK